jgi:hypothetical protein
MEAYDVVRQLGKGGMGTAYCVRSTDGSGGGGFLALKKVACRNVAEGNAALGEAKTLQVNTGEICERQSIGLSCELCLLVTELEADGEARPSVLENCDFELTLEKYRVCHTGMWCDTTMCFYTRMMALCMYALSWSSVDLEISLRT